MPWNITNVSVASDFFSIANSSSNGIFGLGLIVSMYIVIYIILASRESSHDALLVTSVVMAVLSLLLNIVGAVDGILVAPTVAIMLIAIGISFIGGKR